MLFLKDDDTVFVILIIRNDVVYCFVVFIFSSLKNKFIIFLQLFVVDW